MSLIGHFHRFYGTLSRPSGKRSSGNHEETAKEHNIFSNVIYDDVVVVVIAVGAQVALIEGQAKNSEEPSSSPRTHLGCLVNAIIIGG